MRNVSSKKVALLSVLGLGVVLLIHQKTVHGTAEKKTPVRSVQVNENLKLNLPEGAKSVRIWIPIPSNNAYQQVSRFSVKSPFSHRLTQEENFGNSLVFIDAVVPADKKLDIQLTYEVERFEQHGLVKVKSSPERLSDKERRLYLTPRDLIIVDDAVREKAALTTKGLTNSLEKARAIYDYVLANMTYDKTGEGWGRGDVRYACQVGKGNCTDFHSLFIAMMIASHIPARFQMGFPLSQEPAAELKGYHCWAEFYEESLGWVPVDISEAWKNPDKRDYFFGRLDQNRYLVSTGREIQLDPPQAGPALNWLLKPYIEVDGQPLQDATVTFEYKNQKGGQKT